ncbi:probable calcium-binding protein CML21 [Sebastes umbrosus]|uniref:probable calcium-binding protein CML21 n=1 Tax=Sebastes umbrosus TaxID=72105 RepID=UPI00189E4D82|nr:probable calcium-binding protein CML21 [Sebastes umbrosus]
MPELQDAFGLLVDTFNEYAILEGDNTTLTKTELVLLLNTEFRDAKGNAEVEDLFSQLAADRDAVVTFKEFLTIVEDVHLIYTNKSNLSQGMALLKDNFEKYARYEGESDTLTRRDLCVILYKEFPDAPRGTAALDSLMSKLDTDDDGVVSFEEFLTVVVDFYAMVSNKE